MRQLTSIFPHFLALHHPSNLPLKARMFFSSPRIAGFRDFRAKEAQVESENKEHATKKYGKSTKAFGKEATGGGFEVFIFKDCHLMGLGEFHRDVTRPHPKFDREVGEALKLSLLEVGEWLQNYRYFLYVNRLQLLVHIFLFFSLFVYMSEHYFSTYSLTKQYSIHPKMMVTFCNLDFFCMHKYYIPFHIAAIDIQFIGAQVFLFSFSSTKSGKTYQKELDPISPYCCFINPKQLGVALCPPWTLVKVADFRAELQRSVRRNEVGKALIMA